MNHSKARRKAERAEKFGNTRPVVAERGRHWDAMPPGAKGATGVPAGEQGRQEGASERVADKSEG